MKDWMETTNPHTANVTYKKPWLRLRTDKSVKPGSVWLFTDGSSTGWHAASLLVPGKYVRQIAKFAAKTPSRNIAAELNAAILGLERCGSGDGPVCVVHDYLGVGAWTIGAWKINNDEVREKVEKIKKIITDQKLDVSFIHHPGHLDKGKFKDDSEFTRWNCSTDRLCTAQVESDSITTWET